MGKLIRYCKLDEEHTGDNCFDVCRPNVLGNPYTHIKNKETKAQVVVKTRDEAIKLYESYFTNMMESNDNRAKPFQDEVMKIVEAYKKYPEVYIGCYCRKDESCHGDFIIKEVIRRAVKDLITARNRDNGR